MTDRHTADTITSDALDELYARAEAASQASTDAKNWITACEEARTERDQLREVLHVLRYGMARAVPAQLAAEYVVKLIDDTTELITGRAPDPCDRDQQYERVETAEATAADLRRRLEGAHTRLLALAADLEHPKHRGEYGIPHPVVAVMIRDALGGEVPAATEATGPIIDRPFRSHRTAGQRLTEQEAVAVQDAGLPPGAVITREVVDEALGQAEEPAHACTYGERCPNCRD